MGAPVLPSSEGGVSVGRAMQEEAAARMARTMVSCILVGSVGLVVIGWRSEPDGVVGEWGTKVAGV